MGKETWAKARIGKLKAWFRTTVLTWDHLRNFGQHRVIRTSYYWFFLVPAAAKVLGESKHFLRKLMPEDPLIDVNLPFSWKVFFIMTVCYALAQIVYELCCPKIVKLYSSFGDYRRSHAGDGPFVQLLEEFAVGATYHEMRAVNEAIGFPMLLDDDDCQEFEAVWRPEFQTAWRGGPRRNTRLQAKVWLRFFSHRLTQESTR